ncbi:MAG: DUF5103 domain-containing protein [Bacteroidales bacterium]|jgi:hypothetical protein|nr:DUF5103 domain-containing protein [Bacteroidales bacterium]MCK9499679.1 DUF5103 domain-containing protein [Bacteroidales bacterium]MDY0315683.1 DUF5103 domain-containing protein [Bacteroidales bacterium]NLB85661.1 DUF5103 domain-containing protein [Bacteroidales bacterium]
MPIKKIKVLFLVVLNFLSLSLFSINFENLKCEDAVFEKNIKSVRMHPLEWEQGYPVLEFGSDNALSFNFDQIESSPEIYYYTILHCTYDWKVSDLLFFEYADGFDENEIYDYEDSHNTFVNYTHYNLEIPNRDIELTKSGNYLLIVYLKSGGENKIVITKRFMLFENILQINAGKNMALLNDYRIKYQKIDFTILRKALNISEPQIELRPVVMQNYQWNTAKYDFPFSFIDNDKIVYEWEDKIAFDATNEYRYFNFNNLELNSERVEHIEFKKPYYYIDLVKDKTEMFSPYSSVNDINGSYVIRTKRFRNSDFPEVQSEYAIVKFSLEHKSPISNSDVYIYGELTNYSLDENSKMLYNLETKTYEKLLFLKQGYYNYRYVLVDKDGKISHSFFEGSHQQTENAYLLFLYYKSISDNYYRLVNFMVI